MLLRLLLSQSDFKVSQDGKRHDMDLESELSREQVTHCAFMHQSKMIPKGSSSQGQW